MGRPICELPSDIITLIFRGMTRGQVVVKNFFFISNQVFTDPNHDGRGGGGILPWNEIFVEKCLFSYNNNTDMFDE